MPAFGKRRALGQHFLRDPGIIDLIAQTAIDEAIHTGCRSLLEVGPGKGAITRPLMGKLATAPAIETFTLCEFDRKLAEEWRETAETHAGEPGRGFRLCVEEGDFNALSEDRWFTAPPLAVASNLPYSAGTAILTRLARHPRKIPFMVLMFQAEVAHRLRAEPDTKAWGSLSIWIQNRWEVRKLCSAPPRAFAPPPDVDSEVVVLRRRETPLVPVPDPTDDPAAEARWEHLLKGCFAHRRKMLRSGLNGEPELRAALDRSGIEPTLRAEALTWEQWARFYSAL